MTSHLLRKTVPWLEEEEDRLWGDSYSDNDSNWDHDGDQADNDNLNYDLSDESDESDGDDDFDDEESERWDGYDRFAADKLDDDYTFVEGPAWKSSRVQAVGRRPQREAEGYLEKPSRRANRKRFSDKRRRR